MFRHLRLGYVALGLLMLAAVVVTLAIGGQPDPTGPSRPLYGAWRFHPGDDPAWAGLNADDATWDRIVLTSTPDTRDGDVGLPGLLDGWNARGHASLEGYGWYRARVATPPTGALVLLGPTMVDDGYQMFWNGKPIGGIGRFGQHPRVIGACPFLVRLPPSARGQPALLAIRTYMQPSLGRDSKSGGLRSVPILASTEFGAKLYDAEWRRTVAGYIVEIALPLMMVVLAVIAIAVARSVARPAFAHWLSIALIATACLRLGNAIAAWTDVLDVVALAWLNALLLSPLAMLAWTLSWNEWTDRRDRKAVFCAAIIGWAMRVAGAVVHENTLASAGRIVSLVLFVIVAVRIAMRGNHRGLALAAMLPVAVALFINEITRLGIPDIWFPFNIGVTLTQYAYALALPLLCLALTADGTSRSSV